ncbi:hypothetical protein KFE25_003252 [Diacronema lutheri]|uniref:adenosine deaminase n=1 Tax=Diacronema lutheri TaxID=2081491 RepID=A0A8J5XHA4_DIALT|nr:hypothetical protein KFE25_003252 [Diacronema lutheri]
MAQSEEARRAMRIACPADEGAFLRDYAATARLRALPKAQLHMHGDAILRPRRICDALAAFNASPEPRLARARAELGAEAAAGSVRAQHLLPLLDRPTLAMPGPLWTPDGRVATCTLRQFDDACPIAGATGWNDDGELWHGMGGSRDMALVVSIAGASARSAEAWAEASEDAVREGIRWVEYAVGGPADDAAGAVRIRAEAWTEWRDGLLALRQHALDAVPEVGIALVVCPSTPSGAYAAAFAAHLRAEPDGRLREAVRGVGQVGASDPAERVEAYAIFRAAGLVAVNVHAGEWTVARPALVAQSRASVRSAVEVAGARRIGHGIIAAGDAELCALLRERNVCLEVCLLSNRALDNCPLGLAHHPLPALLAAGVPCCLATDNAYKLAAPNAMGLVREYQCAAELLGLDARSLAALAAASFEHSLAPAHVKARALADIGAWLNREERAAAGLAAVE